MAVGRQAPGVLSFSLVGSLRCLVRPDDAGHCFVDGNDGGGAVAAEMAEFYGLEAALRHPYLQLAREGFLA